MAQWKATFRDRRTNRVTEMSIEDATLKGANETASIFVVARGPVVKVEPVKA